MESFEKQENEFYISKYGLPRVGNPNEIWNNIKNNKELLRWAIKPIKDKFGERDIVNGLAICDTILVDYLDIDKEIYQELIDLIYSNKNIARIVQDGVSNGGYSYLLMSLWNPNLKLTEEQKQFAVNEAMNKIGTTKYKQTQEEYSKKLDEHGITDDMTTTIDIDGCIHPIGVKAKNEYFHFMFTMLSDTQAHGTGEFDIRYCILKNPNWTLEEKQKLIMDFWYDDETYDEYLEQWEWGIVNDHANYKGNSLPQFDKGLLYEYSYDALLKFYDDKTTTDRIWNEIQFCKQMHILRPQQWELEFSSPKVLQKEVKRCISL
jgi:hypothetical protein